MSSLKSVNVKANVSKLVTQFKDVESIFEHASGSTKILRNN